MSVEARRALVALALCLCGCMQESAPCANASVPDCSATAPPDFATLQASVLGPRCVVAGACHSVAEHSGGLVLETRDEAFAGLSTHLVPGDARCSLVVDLVTTSSVTRRMPPAGGLSAAERCAIVSWIEAGALP